ncbi:MAG TPA: hypothetical protein VL048_16390 [Xanthobacteraceae bacterium]|nr:hypothetical protein [Xanthobacteraceae bacterium]
MNLSPQQKSAATAPLVRSATECIVHAVVANPRYAAKPVAGRGKDRRPRPISDHT